MEQVKLCQLHHSPEMELQCSSGNIKETWTLEDILIPQGFSCAKCCSLCSIHIPLFLFTVPALPYKQLECLYTRWGLNLV